MYMHVNAHQDIQEKNMKNRKQAVSVNWIITKKRLIPQTKELISQANLFIQRKADS